MGLIALLLIIIFVVMVGPVGWAQCAHEDVDLYNTMVGNSLPTLLLKKAENEDYYDRNTDFNPFSLSK